MTKISDKEHYYLWCKVGNEGLSYYLLHYGPDFKMLEKLGFKEKDLKEIISYLLKLEEKINEGEDKWSEEF